MKRRIPGSSVGRTVCGRCRVRSMRRSSWRLTGLADGAQNLADCRRIDDPRYPLHHRVAERTTKDVHVHHQLPLCSTRMREPSGSPTLSTLCLGESFRSSSGERLGVTIWCPSSMTQARSASFPPPGRTWSGPTRGWSCRPVDPRFVSTTFSWSWSW